jgi:hypothetical protein
MTNPFKRFYAWLNEPAPPRPEIAALGVFLSDSRTVKMFPDEFKGWYEQGITLQMSGSSLAFRYNAIRQRFYGFMTFYIDGQLIAYSFSERDGFYHDAVKLVAAKFDLARVTKEFQEAYELHSIENEMKRQMAMASALSTIPR